MSGKRKALVAGLSLFVMAWLFAFGPRQLGGPVTYIITSGNSMEPGIHDGDLVLARRQSGYAVNDVVAYHNPEMGRTVLHRIVAREGERVTLKGDHNTWLDSHHPKASAIYGRMWIRVPGAGKVVGFFRSPMIAGVAGLLIAAAYLKKPARQKRHGGGVDARPPRASALWGVAGRVSVVAGATGAALIVVGLLTLSLPATRSVPRELTYFHDGAFSYSAAVPPGPVDEDGSISTGEPVYLAVVDRFDVAFTYELSSAEAADVMGTASFEAVLTNDFGWTRTVPLQGRTAFRGKTTTVAGTVDSASLAALTDAVEDQTGTTPGKYRLLLRPVIRVAGSLAGEELDASFRPEFSLIMDDTMLRLDDTRPSDQNRIEPSGDDTLRTTSVVANTLPLPVLDLPVGVGRVAFLGMGLTLVGLAAVSLRPRPASVGHDEAAWIAHRYGKFLVPVTDAVVASDQTVQLGTFAALTEVAMRYESPILFECVDGVTTYAVREGSVWYCYQTGAVAPPAESIGPPVGEPGAASIEPSPSEWTPPARAALSPDEVRRVRDAAFMGQSRIEAFLAKARVEGTLDQMRNERARKAERPNADDRGRP